MKSQSPNGVYTSNNHIRVCVMIIEKAFRHKAKIIYNSSDWCLLILKCFYSHAHSSLTKDIFILCPHPHFFHVHNLISTTGMQLSATLDILHASSTFTSNNQHFHLSNLPPTPLIKFPAILLFPHSILKFQCFLHGPPN